MKLTSELTTTNYTEVHCEPKEEWQYNAPHHFTVIAAKATPVDTNDNSPGKLMGHSTLTEVNFQKGPIKEVGVNGINNEDALLMVMARLQAFQESPYACSENDMALLHLQECLKVLRKRTNKRVERGVEGTSEV